MKHMKRALCLIMALILCMGLFPVMRAEAATSDDKISLVWPVWEYKKDSNGQYVATKCQVTRATSISGKDVDPQGIIGGTKVLPITAPYGVHKNLNRYHRAIDIGNSWGFAVVAAADGTVVQKNYNNYVGYYVIIEHSKTYNNKTVYSRYCHLAEPPKVNVNDNVVAGQVIGLVGGTPFNANGGFVFGPHLDFALGFGTNGFGSTTLSTQYSTYGDGSIIKYYENNIAFDPLGDNVEYRFTLDSSDISSQTGILPESNIQVGNIAVFPKFRKGSLSGAELNLFAGIEKGTPVYLDGTLKATNDVIQTVKVGIYKDGQPVSVNGVTCVNQIDNVNSSSFALSTADKNLPFSQLFFGDYTFKIAATGKSSSLEINIPFMVSAVGSNISTSQPPASISASPIFTEGSLSGQELDLSAGIKKGTAVYLDGTLKATNDVIQTVEVGIYDRNGNPVEVTKSSGTTTKCVYTGTVHSATFDLKNADNGPLLFSLLPLGDYTFKIVATGLFSTQEETIDFTVDSGESWSDWSDWSTTEITPNATTKVETKKVEVKTTHTEYRYGKYMSTESGYTTTGTSFNSGKSHYHQDYFNGAAYKTVYTDWITEDVTSTPMSSFRWALNNENRTGTLKSGLYYWNKFVVDGKTYYWQETRTVETISYETLYRYCTLQ